MIRHAMTVDVEDWYHGIPLPDADKAGAEDRLERGLGALLDLLEDHAVTGTFFWLGPVAVRHPQLLRRTADLGHEIGCHGWSHRLIYDMSPAAFAEESRRAKEAIEDVVGRPVTAYRAAYFSITARSLWALDVLAELGFTHDSSIFPVRNWRYGIPDFDPSPQCIETWCGPLHEFPLPVRRVCGRNLPLTGGAYFRLYPYWLTRRNIRAAERRNTPVVFYIHPWELDPDHPRVGFHWKARLTHYVNLHRTHDRLHRLLAEFAFGPLADLPHRGAPRPALVAPGTG
jgi:polysaccharide deacetylase family protein (PEP-CTERM system associated)